MQSNITKVTCAIILFDENVLVVQRNLNMKLPLKWEFPGGKIEPFETEEECIKREIKEEINIEIELIKKLNPSRFVYPAITIELIPFLAKHVNGEIALKEHKQFLLLKKNELLDLDWAEADIPVLKEFLTYEYIRIILQNIRKCLTIIIQIIFQVFFKNFQKQ